MAREMSNSEKQLLVGSSTFKERLQWAVRAFAGYWAIHTGSGLADTEAARVEWSKYRQLGIQIVKTDRICTDPNAPANAIKLTKGMQFDLAAEPLGPNNDAILAGLLDGITSGQYEEMATKLVRLEGEQIDMFLDNN